MANMTFSLWFYRWQGDPRLDSRPRLVGTAGGTPTNINVDDGQHDNQFSGATRDDNGRPNRKLCRLIR